MTDKITFKHIQPVERPKTDWEISLFNNGLVMRKSMTRDEFDELKRNMVQND